MSFFIPIPAKMGYEEFLEWCTDGRYERKRLDADGVYRSEVVTGFWLKEAWLWQQPPPKVPLVLQELGVV